LSLKEVGSSRYMDSDWASAAEVEDDFPDDDDYEDDEE
jgi:hypothetical protein